MTLKERIIIVCGEFDPITPDDFKFLKKCKEKGDWLVVGLHSDIWMATNRGGFSYNYESRHELLSQLNIVDEIFRFNDTDGTVCNLLKIVKICYPKAYITYVSEQDMHNMPETKIKGINFETFK
jgi:glycerol-3-phosphate cytidylyltransferase-like family protein